MSVDVAERRLLDRFGEIVEAWPATTARLAALLSIPLLGLVDYLSGPEVAFSVFYLLPLSILAWAGDRDRVLIWVGSVLSATTWLVADVASGAEYTHAWIPIWNTATRLTIFLIVATLLTNLRDSVAHERGLARMDPLTGVGNSRSFIEAVNTEIIRTRRQGHPITLAYADIDDFKSINDRIGHSGGNEVLRRVATALDDHTRETDMVGRMGGDEFAILLPETDAFAANVVIADLSNRMAESLADVGFRVTFSLGSVTFVEPPADVDQMINAADDLMYQAKQGGKNTVNQKVYGGASSSAGMI